MSHSTAGLHPRRISARRNSALAGMKLHLSSGANIRRLPRLFHQPCVVRAEIIDAQFVGISVYRAEEVCPHYTGDSSPPFQSPACVVEEQHALSGLYGRKHTVAGILLAALVEVVVGFQQPARPPVVERPFKLADDKVPAVGPPVRVGRLMDKSDIPQPLVVVGGPRASVDYIPHKGFHPVLIPIGSLDAVDTFLGQVGPFSCFLTWLKQNSPNRRSRSFASEDSIRQYSRLFLPFNMNPIYMVVLF